MKNLKKVLAFVIAFTMMLGFSVSASVFPDVEDNASYAEAVTILSSLKIMVGDDTGNFRPDDTITRAEVAAIVVRTLGLEDASNGAKGTTMFTDVAADHWATGYINLATQKGIIAGYGDGTFGPEDPVQYEQVTKMIVAALGYAPKAEYEGGYPTGYLVIASQKGIAKGATGTSGEPAKRSVVARMVFNSLDVELMEQTGFKPGEPEYEESDETLLTFALDVEKYEGVIRNTYLMANRVEEDSKPISLLGYCKIGEEINENAATFTFEEEAVNATEYLGMNVVVYTQENEDDEDVIIAIAPKSGKNFTLALDYTQIENVEFDVDSNVTLVEYSEGSAEDEVVFADNYATIYNGKSGKADVDDWFDRIANDNAVSGGVTLISNDNDEDIEYVIVNEYTDNYLVAEIDAERGIVEDANGRIGDIDLDDEDIILSFFNADGTAAAFEDIAVNDVLSLIVNGNLVKVYITKNTVSGKVSEQRGTGADKAVTIDGKDYKLVDANECDVNAGEEGDFFLNVEGKIFAKKASRDVSTDKYAFAYDAIVDSGLGGATVTVKFFTAAGEWKTLDFAKTVTVYDNSDEGASLKAVPANGETADLGIVTVTSTAREIEGQTIYELNAAVEQQVFMYGVNSAGLINKVYIADGSVRDEADIFTKDYERADVSYDKDDNRIGNLDLAEDTTVISIAVDRGETVEEDDIKVVTVDSIFKDGEEYPYVEAYDYDKTPAVVVVYNAQASIDIASNVMLVTKVTRTRNADGADINKVYGLQAGESVVGETAEDGVEFTDAAGEDLVHTLAAGDIILYGLDAAGAINSVQVIMTLDEASEIIDDNAGAYYVTNDEDEYTNDAFAFVGDKSNGRFVLYDAIGGDVMLADEEQGTELKLSLAKANVYEVNLKKSTPAFDTISASDIRVEDREGKDAHWVYVRMYDGRVIDAVAYRFEIPEVEEA